MTLKDCLGLNISLNKNVYQNARASICQNMNHKLDQNVTQKQDKICLSKYEPNTKDSCPKQIKFLSSEEKKVKICKQTHSLTYSILYCRLKYVLNSDQNVALHQVKKGFPYWSTGTFQNMQGRQSTWIAHRVFSALPLQYIVALPWQAQLVYVRKSTRAKQAFCLEKRKTDESFDTVKQKQYIESRNVLNQQSSQQQEM